MHVERDPSIVASKRRASSTGRGATGVFTPNCTRLTAANHVTRLPCPLLWSFASMVSMPLHFSAAAASDEPSLYSSSLRTRLEILLTGSRASSTGAWTTTGPQLYTCCVEKRVLKPFYVNYKLLAMAPIGTPQCAAQVQWPCQPSETRDIPLPSPKKCRLVHLLRLLQQTALPAAQRCAHCKSHQRAATTTSHKRVSIQSLSERCSLSHSPRSDKFLYIATRLEKKRARRRRITFFADMPSHEGSV